MFVEYIWLDGSTPSPQLRSKSKILDQMISLRLKKELGKDFYVGQDENSQKKILEKVPDWNFDGSSTNQAPGSDSECLLKPIRAFQNPVDGGLLVLCEVFDFQGQPHPSNSRAKAREVLSECSDHQPWAAIEQEYVIYKDGRPLGFPKDSLPPPQGPYYCGVGVRRAFGRDFAIEHARFCLDAGIRLTGINGEVMPAQWEFQVGGPHIDPLMMSDHLWVARWLLHRMGELYRYEISLHPKPEQGDWNGSGAHTNFSTKETRGLGGIGVIDYMTGLLADRIDTHLENYGHGLSHRLTGKHETCSLKDFKVGVGDRTASVRIPRGVERKGMGYFEDRRPNANCDPYKVVTVLMETCCLQVGVEPSFRRSLEDLGDGSND